MTWDEFLVSCKKCNECGLASGRKNVVIGRGENLNAPVLFVGEGPGQQEDIQGEAFVGAAGKLLDTLLEALMFSPDDYYIANIVKCRPPKNRVPAEEEANACLHWLRYQVRCIKPGIIVCLGSTAARYIIDKDVRISRIRGTWIERPGFFDIMPTFHPEALLRDSSKRELMWKDMEMVKIRLDNIR